MNYLGIDIGTSQTKAIAFDEAFRPLAYARVTYDRASPRPGWCELDPLAIQQAVRQVIGDCCRACPRDSIRSLSFAAFGGGVAALDRHARPLLPVISTTDNRAQAEADWWGEAFGRKRTYAIAGMTTHPSLMLPKILWIRRHAAEAVRIEQFVTVAELVPVALGLAPVMDWATASTTMLLDLHRRQWSEEILEAAGLSPALLPPVVPSGSVVGEVPATICDELGLARGCTLIAGGHDQQVCALGAGLTEPGSATDSLGSVECITTLFDKPILSDELLAGNYGNMLHVYGGRIASLAYNFSAGDLLRWYQGTFGEDGAPLEGLLDAVPAEPSELLVLPHFAGSGTPRLDAQSKGAIIGLSLQTGRCDVLRAIIDAQNYEMRLNLEIWRNCGIRFDTLRAYGKGSLSDKALQIKADILGLPIERLNVVETGCLGAALLAAFGGQGRRLGEAAAAAAACQQVFQPSKTHADLYAEKFALYRDLYPAVQPLHQRMQACRFQN